MQGFLLAWLLKGNPPTRFFSFKPFYAGITALAVLALFIPVSQTVLAPARIAPVNPALISAPLDGVIHKILINPNQEVKAGELLFILDDALALNRREVASQALKIAQAEYLRTQQQAFQDSESKARLEALKATIAQRQIELEYSQKIWERTKVHAPQAGLAVLANKEEWEGRPVQTGEKILQIADPAKAELEIWLPVNDAIKLPDQAKVGVFLNVAPLNPLPARLYHTSYEPGFSPEGILAYKLKAEFTAPQELPKIGLKATAKLYGEEVSLAYYLFRRPLATLRQWLGV